jgi:thioredoxin reductase (NADPH)
MQEEQGHGVVVYGTTWCPDCKRAKQFLGDQRVQYTWVDVEQDSQAMAWVEQANDGKHIVPTIVFPDGSTLVEPSNAQLADKLGLARRASHTFYDVVIVGGGPAGLTAGLYLAREGLETLLLDRSATGGQAGITQILENFPGFDEGISGAEFARRLTRQAKRFGVEILQAQEVSDIHTNGQYREVQTADGGCYAARAILVTTGARYRRLNVPGEEELIGTSIHFCATCDGAFYKGKDVLVVGGGNSGFEEGLFLTKFARQVTIVEFLPEVRASKILQQSVAGRHNMQVITNHSVQEFIVQRKKLAGVKVMDRATEQVSEWHPDGVFIFIGLSPNSDFLPSAIERARGGFVVTDKTLQTTMTGVFAAGDVRAGSTAQAAAAAGEGATVALMIRDYLKNTY